MAEAVTLDTAYGISSNLQAATCTIHTGGVYVPSEYEMGGNPGAVPDPNAVPETDPNAVPPTDPNVADPNTGAPADPAAPPPAEVPSAGAE